MDGRGRTPRAPAPFRTPAFPRPPGTCNIPLPSSILQREAPSLRRRHSVPPRPLRHRMLRVLLPALILLTLAIARPAEAQRVTGRVEDATSGAAVPGALVVLLDPSGARFASTLSDERGRFALETPRPGRYTLHVRRIGLRDVVSPPFDLAAGEVVERRVATVQETIVLEGITASSRRRCSRAEAGGALVATLWSEIGKALEATAVSERERLFGFRTRSYVRRLDPGDLRVLSDSSVTAISYGPTSPFVSHPAEYLLANGFIEREGGEERYHAPDAHVLLADGFVESYCFRTSTDPRRPELLGLSFEPTGRQGPAAVTGTLWLDRETLALRLLEYGYVRADLPRGNTSRVGGQIEFERLPTGVWIVRRWWIRTPITRVREVFSRDAPVQAIREVVGLSEEGAEVLEILEDGAPVMVAGDATLVGGVADLATGLPLAGALVYLEGTGHAAAADTAGRFEMRSLPAGEFTLTFRHPAEAELSPYASRSRVSLVPGGTTNASLVLPGDARLRFVSSRCAARPVAGAEGDRFLSGLVIDETTLAPVAGATVTLSWSEPGARRRAEGDTHFLAVETDSAGRYVACGLPADRALVARASRAARASPEMAVGPLPAGELVDQPLTLGPSRPVPLTVRVMDWESGRGIAGAEVSLPRLGISTRTDRSGRAVFTAVPQGATTLQIRHIAYGEQGDLVMIGEGGAELDVRVPLTAIALEGVSVAVAGGAERARVASGTRQDLLTRADLEQEIGRSRHVGDLMRRFPFLRVRYLDSGEVCIESNRGSRQMRLTGCDGVLLVLDGVPVVGMDQVLSLEPAFIESVQFLGAAEAGALYGRLGTNNGALVIYTKGRGPWAGGR